MLRPDHPEVLAPDWVPPVLVGRAEPIERLRTLLSDPERSTARIHGAIVRGPPASGTSTVARRAALDLVERLRRSEPSVTPPLYAPVRVPWVSGVRGIAAELLQRFDPEFTPRGFPVAEMLAGFLRRLGRSGRSAVVVLDDLRADAPDITPVVRALVTPARFLPEGDERLPRIFLILAGTDEVGSCWAKARVAGFPEVAPVELCAYGDSEVRQIVRDRGRRALGREPPEEWLERWVGGPAPGLSPLIRAMERMRRELLGPEVATARPVPRDGLPRPRVEPRLLDAIARAAADGPIFLRAVRAWEARLAREEGVRPLPSTTLWRRIVRLEAEGWLRREVRTGGDGGTQSRLEVVGELPKPDPYPRFSTPRGVGWPSGLARS